MKPARARTLLRLRGVLFALSIAAIATQAGSAPLPLRATHALHIAHSTHVAHATVAGVSLPDALELTASFAGLLRVPPASGGWALLFAGLTGILAIGRRRMSALGSLSFDPQRLRRR